jgi:hypothetical protein
MTSLLEELSTMKKLNKKLVGIQLRALINNLFGTFVKGRKGWKYEKQSKWLAEQVFERAVQACEEATSLTDACDAYEGAPYSVVHRRLTP